MKYGDGNMGKQLHDSVMFHSYNHPDDCKIIPSDFQQTLDESRLDPHPPTPHAPHTRPPTYTTHRAPPIHNFLTSRGST